MSTKQEMARRRETLRPHPVREQIVDVMRAYGKPISPTQLARVTGKSLGSIAYHVRTLVSAGIVTLAGEGRVRGAVEHFYALVDEETRLSDEVGQLLSLCGALTMPAPDGGYPRPVVLDDGTRSRLESVIDKLRDEVQTIVAQAERRAA
jgi:DNA-binding transcriptional ArsR family regulator